MMSGQDNTGEKQAVIVASVIAVLVLIAGFIGFAIWDRPDPVSPESNKVAISPKSPAPNVPRQRGGPKPTGSPGEWVTSDDYPTRALQQEREGTTEFRLTISENGRPLFCSITSSSGHEDLDTATCKALMRNARFNPALDTSGKPVVSSYASRVRWQIPR
jgi:periplasmic protein TonB